MDRRTIINQIGSFSEKAGRFFFFHFWETHTNVYEIYNKYEHAGFIGPSLEYIYTYKPGRIVVVVVGGNAPGQVRALVR